MLKNHVVSICKKHNRALYYYLHYGDNFKGYQLASERVNECSRVLRCLGFSFSTTLDELNYIRRVGVCGIYGNSEYDFSVFIPRIDATILECFEGK